MTRGDLDFADRTQMTLHLRGRLDDWLLTEIESRLAKNKVRLQRLREAYHEAADALRAAGVEFVILKGFTHRDFGIDPNARVQHDIDLLIEPASQKGALAALERLGYQPHGRELSREHAPPMVRPFTWQWRGDWYDPDMPIAFELHTTIWDHRRDRIVFPSVETFWARRVHEPLPALEATDRVAFAALHVVRHILRTNIKISPVYELSVLLRRLDASWWRVWESRYDPAFRELQQVAFRFAHEWFGSPRPPEFRPQIEDWFAKYAWSPVDSLFEPNKDTLGLHLALLPRWYDRALVIQDRLLPLKIPHAPGRALHHARAAATSVLRWLKD